MKNISVKILIILLITSYDIPASAGGKFISVDSYQNSYKTLDLESSRLLHSEPTIKKINV